MFEGEFPESRTEVDIELRRKLENACRVALRRSKGSADEKDVIECVRILEEYVSSPDDYYQADIEAQLGRLGIRQSFATKLTELALKWSRRR